MSKRQKQHLGRSEGDDTMLEGRDIRADTPDGIGSERVDGAFEGGAEASEAAIRIEEKIEENRKETQEAVQ
jgi:hypothetical protein